jgi:hypothetical protein
MIGVRYSARVLLPAPESPVNQRTKPFLDMERGSIRWGEGER